MYVYCIHIHNIDKIFVRIYIQNIQTTGPECMHKHIPKVTNIHILFYGETEVEFQVEPYHKLKKWYLMSPCLTLCIKR